MVKRLLIALAIIGAIPLVGYLIALGILYDIDSQIESGLNIEAICELQRATANRQVQSACDQVRNIALLRDASIWAGTASIALMVLYWGAALVAGKNRTLNAFIFPKLIPTSQLFIAGLVLVEGAIITYAAYIGEVYAIERVHYFLIGAIGLGALIGAVKLIVSTLTLKEDFSQPTFGKQVKQSEEPKLWKFLEQIADKLGSQTPGNVVVGLEPTFYATAAPVRLLNEDKTLSGETLYLSLPLMRLFSTEELRAVIGHELGHFRGADTAYSLKFAPVYAGLSRSIDALASEEEGMSSIAKLPAAAMLSLMLEIFARNERRISQERELEADKASIEVSSSSALASALGKVAIYTPIWANVLEKNIDRLNEGEVSGNLSQIFEDSARQDVSHTGIAEVMEEILATKITHPTDTHPTIFERFENIGFDSDHLTVDVLIDAGNSGQELLENYRDIEEELTLFEHRYLIALGHVSLPDEDDGDKPPIQIGPAAIAMLPVKTLLENEPPFSDWQDPTTEVQPEYEDMFRIVVIGYQLYVYNLLIARKFGNRVASIVRQDQVDRLNRLEGRIGDQFEALLNIIGRGVEAGVDGPRTLPDHPEVEVPIEYSIALSALIMMEGSPSYIPPEDRQKGTPPPDIPDGPDFDLAVCLAHGKEEAMKVFEPWVAVMEVDKDELAEWVLERPEAGALQWSENPGCFEGHLKRKHDNPLFPKPDRKVTQDQIDQARERDHEDAAKLQEEFLELGSDLDKLPELATVGDLGPIRERIDDLLEKAAGIGGDADAISDSLIVLRKSLIDSMREGMKDNEESLKALGEAEEYHHSRVEISLNPFVAQIRRISAEDIIPAMVNESPDTIRKVLSLFDDDTKGSVVKEACDLMKSALAEGSEIPLVDEKLKALRDESD